MRTKNIRILEAMWAMGLTQAVLARKANLRSESRLSRIINMLELPSQTERESITKALGKSEKDLWGKNV